jgi:hypothetical protein
MKIKESEMTIWVRKHTPSYKQPKRVGVYQVSPHSPSPMLAYWNGKTWSWFIKYDEKYLENMEINKVRQEWYFYDKITWRGFKKEQKA